MPTPVDLAMLSVFLKGQDLGSYIFGLYIDVCIVLSSSALSTLPLAGHSNLKCDLCAS